MSDPTVPELVRRLDDVVRSLERITANIDSNYLRRDVYEARHVSLRREVDSQLQAVKDDLRDVQEARKAEAAYRKQILAGFAVAILVMLVNLALATSNFIARVGAGG